MKRFFTLALAAFVLMAGCTEGYDGAMLDRIKDLEDRMNGLENLASQLSEAQNDNVYVVSYDQLADGSGWRISFSNGEAIEVTNGVNGIDGKDGKDGVDGKDGTNGKDGAKGDTGETGAQGDPGNTGPQGNPGSAGDSLIRSISEDGDTIVIRLVDGRTFYFQKPLPTIAIATQPLAPAALVEGEIPSGTRLTVAASATENATLKYRWFKNTANNKTEGTIIGGATSASYTLPASLAVGTHYYYCEVGAENMVPVLTDVVTVNVNAYPGKYSDTGVEIGGVVWATRNVDAPGTFVAHPEDYGMLYQFCINVGWSNTLPLISSNGSTEWISTVEYLFDDWNDSISPDTCPEDWHVPTADDLRKLAAAPNEWTTENGVVGRRFGTDDASIFLPAAGDYPGWGDTEVGIQGRYWSATGDPQHRFVYGLDFDNGSIEVSNLTFTKVYGLSLRCVAGDKRDM
ncbi:MAG: hypothetical protein LBU97_04480 [Alistipes sp.]|jgi:uncharacterized protein (TIGR02145 family)|nr:hypothetical protein [Alistipes sp.]